MRAKLSLLPFLFWWLIASPAFAIEALCPGGATPRGDIEKCIEFENLSHCTTGKEALCVSDNNLDSLNDVSSGFQIGTCPITPAVGSGCVYGSGEAGGTGPGYGSFTMTSTTAASLRYYVKWENGFMFPAWDGGNHSPLLNWSGACNGYITGDVTAYGVNPFVETAGCTGGPTSYRLTNNLDDTWRPKNGRWYLYEIRAVMNTTTSGSGAHQGNGTVEMWIDGTKRASWSDLNIRGSTNATFTGGMVPRSYYGLGIASWKSRQFFDNAAISNNGTYIGPAGSENSRGTASTTTPIQYVAYDAHSNMKNASDCSTGSGYGNYLAIAMQWRNGATWQTNTMHNGYVNNGACAGWTNKAMKASVTGTGQGAGLYYEMFPNIDYDRVVVHGWIYLPAANDYTTANTPLAGFSRYASNNWSYYAALGRNSSGNWSVFFANNGPTAQTDTAVPASTNTWHEFELQATTNSKVNLYIDGYWILEDSAAPYSIGTWLTDNQGAGSRNIVFGIMNYTQGTNFDVYYDDTDAGHQSFVSCKGWDNGYCPPALSPTPTPTPTPTATPTPAPGVASAMNKTKRGRR